MTEAKPAIPPKSPCPKRRPNKPAPRKPAARPPSIPPLNKPERGAAWPTEFDLPGCASERCIGVAAFGAVGVAGGAEKVRVPRLPPEDPPPARACASAAMSKHAIIAAIAIEKRLRIMWPSRQMPAREYV